MSVEKFIHIHDSYREGGEHSHPSMASTVRRLEEAQNKIWEFQQQDLVLLEKRYGIVVGDQLQPFVEEEREIYNCE